MHTDVADIADSLAEIRGHWDGAMGAYAHHGGWEPPHWIFHDITPEDYAEAALGWVSQGAQIIGGCCGIGPAHIAQLHERLPARV
jgi:homocysteine S-methyltransferase